MVYIELFHGRDTVEQEMEDWGFRGPTIGPFRYVQITYMCDIKFAMEREAFKEAFPEVFAEWVAKGFSNTPATMMSIQNAFVSNIKSCRLKDVFRSKASFTATSLSCRPRIRRSKQSLHRLRRSVCVPNLEG